MLAALETAKVRYLVVGGVAVVLHGHLRTTADLDLVVELAPENARRAIAALAARSERLPGVEVDLFVEEPLPFEEAYARAVRVALDTTSATVVSLEDLIAMKRAAGRPVDLADIEALRALQGGSP